MAIRKMDKFIKTIVNKLFPALQSSLGLKMYNSPITSLETSSSAFTVKSLVVFKYIKTDNMIAKHIKNIILNFFIISTLLPL